MCVSPGGNFDANSVFCEFDSLPFEDGAFNIVVAHHVLGEKLPGDLEELQRVLSHGGQLLIIGRGLLDIKGRFRADSPAALNLYSTQHLLRRRGFRIISCEGFGIFGMNVRLNRSWQKLFLPFSDRVLIRAQHHINKHVATPLRFSSPQAAGVRSAALDSLNREAV